MDYKTYPNRNGKKPDDESRGALRVGIVEANADTTRTGLAGYVAAVTHEADGEVRFYIFTTTPEDSMFPNNPLWIGPYTALSEEIVEENPPMESEEDKSLEPFEKFLNREEGE
jgi:hypothetical protein